MKIIYFILFYLVISSNLNRLKLEKRLKMEKATRKIRKDPTATTARELTLASDRELGEALTRVVRQGEPFEAATSGGLPPERSEFAFRRTRSEGILDLFEEFGVSREDKLRSPILRRFHSDILPETRVTRDADLERRPRAPTPYLEDAQPIEAQDQNILPLLPKDVATALSRAEYISEIGASFKGRDYAKDNTHKPIVEGEMFCFSNSGCYKVLSVIARGGQGAVYKARDIRGQLFTIKFKSDISNDRNIAHFRDIISNSTRYISSLRDIINTPNPFFARQYDNLFFFTRSRRKKYVNFAILGDFINEDTLEKFLHDHRADLTPEQWTELFYRLLRSVSEFHKATGLAHVDIKPSNIMADFRLIDFDSVRELDSQIARPSITPIYSAPEIMAEGHNSVTGYKHVFPYWRADEWAVGIIIYMECHTQHHPWFIKTQLTTFTQIQLLRLLEPLNHINKSRWPQIDFYGL